MLTSMSNRRRHEPSRHEPNLAIYSILHRLRVGRERAFTTPLAPRRQRGRERKVDEFCRQGARTGICFICRTWRTESGNHPPHCPLAGLQLGTDRQRWCIWSCLIAQCRCQSSIPTGTPFGDSQLVVSSTRLCWSRDRTCQTRARRKPVE
jgi:hypothetical protein